MIFLREGLGIVNSNGIKLAGSGIPSSELFLHLAIYKKYPTFNAIIHTHSLYASACAAMHRQIRHCSRIRRKYPAVQ
jgi:L-fuculose-phosphate aldolase